MAWKKAYPTPVVKKTVDLLQKHHKIKITQSDVEEAIQKCKSVDDLATELNKKFKKAKATELKKTLEGCGF